MDASIASLNALLTGPALAAFGPGGAVAVFLAWIVWSYFRGREERMAQLNDQIARTLREDQRALFQEQARSIEGLRVDLATMEARMRATELLCSRLRSKFFDMYVLCRENTHAAVNARQLVISAGIKRVEDFPPIVWPETPTID